MDKEEKEYVLYKGEKFTVEWYYNEKNKSQPFEYFNSLSSQQQMKLLYLVKRIGDFGKISDKTKFLSAANEIIVFGKTYWRLWENFR